MSNFRLKELVHLGLTQGGENNSISIIHWCSEQSKVLALTTISRTCLIIMDVENVQLSQQLSQRWNWVFRR